MTLKKQAEVNGYVERLEGWPKKEDSLIIRCMAKALLSYANESPLLYIAERGNSESFGVTEEEARQKLVQSMRK